MIDIHLPFECYITMNKLLHCSGGGAVPLNQFFKWKDDIRIPDGQGFMHHQYMNHQSFYSTFVCCDSIQGNAPG